MKLAFRGINYRGNTIGLFLLGVSIIINFLPFVTMNLDVLSWIAEINSIIPNVFMILLIYGFWDTLLNNRFYVYMLPISKKKVAVDIFLKWFLLYISHYMLYIGSILVKVDTNILFNNINIKGNIINLLVSTLEPIMVTLIIVCCMIISKAYKINPVFFIIGFLLVARFSYYFDDNSAYVYKDNVDMWRLKSERTIHLINDNSDVTNDNVKKDVVYFESNNKTSIFYHSIRVCGSCFIALLIVVLIGIEKLSMEEDIKPIKRRTLYEEKWYHKFL